MILWTPHPVTWAGFGAVAIAGGPSLTDDHLALIARARPAWKVAVVNNVVDRAPWADLLYASDQKWWDTYAPDFAGLKVTRDPRQLRADVAYIPSVPKPGFSLAPHVIHEGHHGGYQLVNILLLLGCHPIVLVGYDYRLLDDRLHSYPDHRPPMANPTAASLQAWAALFEATRPMLAQAGVSILNATPGSALPTFPMVELATVLAAEWVAPCA